MTLAQARALIGSRQVIEVEHRPERDAAALHRLATWALRFSPLVAADPPDGLLLDVSGCHLVHGGERRLLNAIGNQLDRLGFVSRLCCAGTIGCAWGVARFGSADRSVVEAGEERRAIEALPIESLRLDRQTIHALHEVNVDQVGQLLAIPRLQLASRFGESPLRRIDQALGEAFERIEPIRPRVPIVAERLFNGVLIDLEALMIVGRELIEEVAAALTRQERGATRLVVRLDRLDSTPIRIDLRFSYPSREVRHLWSLLARRLETVHLGYGIERFVLVVAASGVLAHQQRSQWDDDAARRSVDRTGSELIDVLSDRVGPARVLRMTIAESHRPERIARLIPAMAPGVLPPPGGLGPVNRPSRLFDAPVPIEAVSLASEDGPPVRLRWYGGGNPGDACTEELEIVAADGPERLSGLWWSDERSDAPTRDYFRVCDARGRMLWVFRSVEDGRWWLHGEWV